MLILARKVGERIRIADNIEVIVLGIQGDRIKIGIEAPKTVRVRRGELDGEMPLSRRTPVCLANRLSDGVLSSSR